MRLLTATESIEYALPSREACSTPGRPISHAELDYLINYSVAFGCDGLAATTHATRLSWSGQYQIRPPAVTSCWDCSNVRPPNPRCPAAPLCGLRPTELGVGQRRDPVGFAVHFMTPDFDMGDVVLQESVPVAENDTVIDLYHKTLPLFGPMILTALDRVESGQTTWNKQDMAAATFFHKRSVEDSRIHWKDSAAQIHRLVRAQVDPYPNAFAFLRDRRVRILESAISPTPLGGTPGRIFLPVGDTGVAVVCGPNSRTGAEHGLVICRVRDDNGVEYTGREFFPAMGGYLTSWPVE
jgi:Formyl transferase, C-terminal domain